MSRKISRHSPKFCLEYESTKFRTHSIKEDQPVFSTPFTEIQSPYLAEDASAAWLFCDRHDPAKTAYTIVDASSTRAVTYGELRRDSLRLSHALQDLGVTAGTRVATLVRKGPELVTTMMAVWRLGAVYVPLFTAFAGKAVEFRIRMADVRVVITDSAQREKLNADISDIVKVIVVDGVTHAGDLDYQT